MKGKLFLTAGVSVAILSILPPVHGAAERLLSAHMLQHLTLMMIAAPLIALALPPVPRLGPIPVWIAATAILWAWHLPVLYDAALASPVLHALEHFSFLATSIAFWSFVLVRTDVSAPTRVGLTFASGLQSSALGALLAFASAPLYDSHLATPSGRTPLEDQQLAGALMWVPPGVVYLAVMVALLYHWFKTMESRVDAPARGGLS